MLRMVRLRFLRLLRPTKAVFASLRVGLGLPEVIPRLPLPSMRLDSSGLPCATRGPDRMIYWAPDSLASRLSFETEGYQVNYQQQGRDLDL